jgi:hypothetical protein
MQVLRPAPSFKGDFVCTVDSFTTANSPKPRLDCNAGAGRTFTLKGDSVYSVTQVLESPTAPPSTTILDYWNSHFREYWSARFGKPPDRLEPSRQNDFEYFSAVWDTPIGVRHIIEITRRSNEAFKVELASIDCRERDRHKQAIGCW